MKRIKKRIGLVFRHRKSEKPNRSIPDSFTIGALTPPLNCWCWLLTCSIDDGRDQYRTTATSGYEAPAIPIHQDLILMNSARSSIP